MLIDARILFNSLRLHHTLRSEDRLNDLRGRLSVLRDDRSQAPVTRTALRLFIERRKLPHAK